jgi:hypothetical protein
VWLEHCLISDHFHFRTTAKTNTAPDDFDDIQTRAREAYILKENEFEVSLIPIMLVKQTERLLFVLLFFFCKQNNISWIIRRFGTTILCTRRLRWANCLADVLVSPYDPGVLFVLLSSRMHAMSGSRGGGEIDWTQTLGKSVLQEEESERRERGKGSAAHARVH